MHITIAGRDYPARLPVSYTVQQELAALLYLAPLRAAPALLALSCEGLTRVQLAAHRYDMGAFGAAVGDALHRSHGLSVTDCLELAAPLIEALAARNAPPSEEEVSGAEDFFAEPERSTP